MIDSLYRSASRWSTAGAKVPASRDPTTDDVRRQCGVYTANGTCRSVCQHSLFCPTHERLANKYTKKYHACTKVSIVHSETTRSAQQMLRYIVALRTVVYIMHKDASEHKSLDDDAAATHMMAINYFERLIRQGSDMSVDEFVTRIKSPSDTMAPTMPLSMEHLLNEPRIQEDLLSDATAQDIVAPEAAPEVAPEAASTTTDRATASKASATRRSSRRTRTVMSDVTLRRYEETGTEIVDSIEMWVELLRRVDRGINVQIVLSFAYVNHKLENSIRSTGTVITYMYDASSGKYTFGSDSFYGRDGVKLEDYQVMPFLSFDASTTARPTSEAELLSKATQSIVFNAQNCFLIEFTALTARDHRAFREYVGATLLVLSEDKRYKRAIRALLDVETITSQPMSRRKACGFKLLSKRFLSNTDVAIKTIFDADMMRALRTMKKDRNKRVGQIDMTHPESLVRHCMGEEVFINIVESRVKYIVSATPASASVANILRLWDKWWRTQPISTLTVTDKLFEQTLQFSEHLAALQNASTSDGTVATFAAQMAPHKMDFLQRVQQQIKIEMEKTHNQPSRPVLVASDIDELNRQTQALLVSP